MKVPSTRKKQNIRFDMTPLIDVVFLLIIFFLVSSHFVRSEAGVEVTLPQLKSSRNVDALPNHMVITVTISKKWYLDKKEYHYDDIKELVLKQVKDNPTLVIKLRCDEGLKYGYVEPFIRYCQLQNVSEVQFSAKGKN